MSLAGQAKLILKALQDSSLETGGRAFIASDPIDCIERLRMKPGVPGVGVLWYAEDPRDLDVLGRVGETWKVVVSRGRSLKLQAGESLIEGAAGGPPMFDLVESVRNAVLAIRMTAPDGIESEDSIPVYLGSGPFEVNGMLFDAVEIRFVLAGQLAVQEGG